LAGGNSSVAVECERKARLYSLIGKEAERF
jgi:hypothetical protein